MKAPHASAFLQNSIILEHYNSCFVDEINLQNSIEQISVGMAVFLTGSVRGCIYQRGENNWPILLVPVTHHRPDETKEDGLMKSKAI